MKTAVPPDPGLKNPPAIQPPQGKTWKAGTLTYTTAGLATVFFWLLLGDFAWSMRDRSVGPAAEWYLSHLGVSNLLFGLILSSFPSLISLLLGPIISVKSDRHRGKWGRRIPFLLVTTPAAALGIVGIGLTPTVARWAHGFFPGQSELVVTLVCFGVFWAAFELATIAGQSVFGGLINDVVPKELLGRFHALFRAVSLIDGMIFNYWIIGKVPEHFTLIVVSIGLFYGICFFWVCFKIKEGDYAPPPPPSPDRKGWAKGFLGGARLYFKECFTNRYYLSLFVLCTVAGLSFTPVNIFTIPQARSLGISMDTYGKVAALVYLISLSLSYFLGWLADLFHPLRMMMATLFGYAVVTLWGGFAATTPNAFLLAWVLHGVLSGCYYTSAASLGQRLFPHAKYAQFASAARLVGGPTSMVLGPLAGVLIDRTGNIYRYTFTAGCVLACISLFAAWQVYLQFMKLGGPKHYVAPE